MANTGYMQVQEMLQNSNATIATAVTGLNTAIAAIVPAGGPVTVIAAGIQVLSTTYTCWAMVSFQAASE